MSIFNPKQQQLDTTSKIVVGLERISEAFKVLLWQKAKELGLSPIQIKILLFIAYHKIDYCNVSHLAKEFNVTKPTISDAIRVLDYKELIIKDHSSTDSRSYSILVSEKGKKVVTATEDFAQPIQKQLSGINNTELSNVFKTLSKLIYQLNKSDILTVQRTCYACKFYDSTSKGNYCNLLETSLKAQDIRLDCPEFEESALTSLQII